MRTPSFYVKILVEKARIIRGYLRYIRKSSFSVHLFTTDSYIDVEPVDFLTNNLSFLLYGNLG